VTIRDLPAAYATFEPHPCAPKDVPDELDQLAISIDDEQLGSIFSICPRLLHPGRWISRCGDSTAADASPPAARLQFGSLPAHLNAA
jgi:hypothetical protein